MTDTDPEVSRIAALCEAACLTAMKAWLHLPAEGHPRSTDTFWLAVARAVIADRATQESADEAPALIADTDTLSGAEEILRRIAASPGLYLDATEAGAIVAELDRLRALCDEVSAQNAMVRHERDEARRERDAAETRSADVDGRLVEYGRRAERAAVCAYLRAVGCSLIPDALERGEHLPTKEPQR